MIASPPRAPATAWLTLFALVATLLFAFVNRQVFTLVAAPMQVTLGFDDQQLGVLQGIAFAVFTVIAVYPIGWLADRFDRRLILAACIFTWTTGTVLCGLAQSVEQLFLACVFVAAGEAGLPPLVLAAIPDLFKGRQLVLANLVFFASSILGVALGFALGGIAIGAVEEVRGQLPHAFDGLESWRLAFLMVALPAPLFILCTPFLHLRRPTNVAVNAAVSVRHYLRTHGSAFALVVGSIVTCSMAFSGFYIWLPVAMTRSFGIQPAQNGGLMAATLLVASVSGIVIAGLLLRALEPRLGKRVGLAIAFVVMIAAAPFALLLPFATSAMQIYGLVGIQLFAGTIFGAIVPNLIQAISPVDVRTRLFAVYTIALTLSSGIAVWLTGLISSLSGRPDFLLIAMTLVSVPAWLTAAALARVAQPRFVKTVSALEAAERRPQLASGALGASTNVDEQLD